ncbi:cobalt-precorrin-6A reductase [Leptolyngbya ohadii]|uniref:cobalt-precorrin-6A reductase n=1 Tax=Leptolyngbya ohadii TaxID=1962290 RepID=UPI000B59F5FF|nr:cobalt-precorrin-6A reductase [Leptolyngbya ohadii]
MALVWIIGGTQESAALVRSLASTGIPCLVTVTTESARSLYPIDPQVQVWVGRLQPETLPAFLQAHSICCLVDASHPFAAAVSQTAIAASVKYQIPYLRYERQAIPAQGTHFESFEALLASDCLQGERVLLTIGYRPLALFQPWQTRSTLFARILPSQIALEAALQAGFTPDRLIALRPPISIELERALWKQWQISLVVTKASGSAGGEDTKQQLSAELGIPLIVIDRPPVQYPQQTQDIQTTIDFCRRHLA